MHVVTGKHGMTLLFWGKGDLTQTVAKLMDRLENCEDDDTLVAIPIGDEHGELQSEVFASMLSPIAREKDLLDLVTE